MAKLDSIFLNTLMERGFIHQCTDLDKLDRLMSKKIVSAYEGFDCTAPSLHVGNLVGIMMLRHLQKSGHQPLVLMGGGTTKVGDPSGKESSRQMLSDNEIKSNMLGIQRIFSRFLDFGVGPTGAIMVNNADWLDSLEYIPFLRDFGQHFSVNRMLSMDSVKLRLERQQPLSFLEFNYMILQAYDFLELARRHDCSLQLGGSDQWGNIVNGVELGRRIDERALFGLTAPLLTTGAGEKMGKTADGAVWLNEDMLSPYNYWQFWRNTNDVDVGRFLKLFTELPLGEIAKLESLQEKEINEAKKILADEATRLCHGDKATALASATAHQTFENGGFGANLPEINITFLELKKGIAAFEILYRTGLCSSRGEARRLIKGGGGRVNGKVIEDEGNIITIDHIGTEGLIKISVGRKRHAVIKPT